MHIFISHILYYTFYINILHPALQFQKAVSGCFKSEQILRFGFARQIYNLQFFIVAI